MKNNGFILKQTIFLMLLILGISTLLSKTVRFSAGREKVKGESRSRDYLLDSVGEIGIYELYLLDGYIKDGVLASVEDYFYTDSEGESIFRNYKNFIMDQNQNISSIGGYRIKEIKPDPRDIYIPNNYRFLLKLSKEVELVGENDLLLKINIATGDIEIRCYIDPFKEKIECENPSKIRELSLWGE
ncbi:MAG: hypothetical protein ACRCZ9_12920 [Fusobacteriaceae bacterium]